MILRLFTVFAVTLSLSGIARSDDKDAEALQGAWLPSKAELGGKDFPAKNFKLEVKGDAYTVTAESPDKGTVKLNTSAKPKEMDITGTDGPNKGKTFKAIYELDGDTLRVCY